MEIAKRIQELRKQSGMSQEELANQMHISRQAVSKWEAQASLPDLENIITLSDLFHVSTDYLLKGVEEKKDKNETISEILYITSLLLIVIGLLCTWGSWYETQTMDCIFGGMLIQMVGIAAYLIAAALSERRVRFWILYLDVMLVLWMPISMLSQRFRLGILAPYPLDRISWPIFLFGYGLAAILVWFLCRYLRKHHLV